MREPFELFFQVFFGVRKIPRKNTKICLVRITFTPLFFDEKIRENFRGNFREILADFDQIWTPPKNQGFYEGGNHLSSFFRKFPDFVKSSKNTRVQPLKSTGSFDFAHFFGRKISGEISGEISGKIPGEISGEICPGFLQNCRP